MLNISTRHVKYLTNNKWIEKTLLQKTEGIYTVNPVF